MNDTQKLYQTLNENAAAGLRQWQEAARTWNTAMTEAWNGQVALWNGQIDTWFAQREQATQVWMQAAHRAQDLFQREQKLFAQAGEQARAQMKPSTEWAAQWVQMWTDAAQVWSTEAGQALQKQTHAAQEQMNHVLHQATAAQTQVNAMWQDAAETLQTAVAAPTNGSRARAKS